MEEEKKPRKRMTFQRIAAIIAAGMLVLLYLITLISAIFTTKATPQLFKASLAATVIIPVLLYGYQLIYRIIGGNNKHK